MLVAAGTPLLPSTPAAAGSYSWNIPVTLPEGSDYQVRASNAADGSLFDVSDGNFTIESPPEITAVTLSPTTLWPPNNKMAEINATLTVTGGCGSEPSVSVSVSGDDGADSDDWSTANWVWSTNTVIDLRAQRTGQGDGRTYTITFTATDAYGNSVSETADVVVPHDQGQAKSSPFALRKDVASSSSMHVYPNPSAEQVQIGFTTQNDGLVTMSIVDLSGRVVTTVLSDNLSAGEYVTLWLGKDNNGSVVPAGRYFITLDADGSTSTVPIQRSK